MRSTIHATVLLLTGATVLVTAMLSLTLARPMNVKSGSDRNQAVARAFYDSINEMLITGDDRALNEITAPYFIEHDPLPGFSPDRAGLLGHIESLRALGGELRLVVRSIEAAGDEVMGQVELVGSFDVPGASDVELWRSTEYLQISRGHVIGRSGSNRRLVIVRLTSIAPPLHVGDGNHLTRLTLLTLPPRSSTRLPTPAKDAQVWLLSGNADVVLQMPSVGGDEPKHDHEVLHAEAGTSFAHGPGTVARISTGTDGATLAIISSHEMSPLGGPLVDRSQFGPGNDIQSFDLPIGPADSGIISLVTISGAVDKVYATNTGFENAQLRSSPADGEWLIWSGR